MKKIMLVLLLCSFSLAEPLITGPICLKPIAEEQSVAESKFKENPIKYYKRWALAYCLGYSSDENKMTRSGCIKSKKDLYISNMGHIDNVVRLWGDEALSEIKDYLDKSYFFELKDKVNNCFERVYESERFQKKLEEIVKKSCENYEYCKFAQYCRANEYCKE